MKYKDLTVGEEYTVSNPLWRRKEFRVLCSRKDSMSFSLIVISKKVKPFNKTTTFLPKGQMIRDLKSVIPATWSVNRQAAQAMRRIDQKINKAIEMAKIDSDFIVIRSELRTDLKSDIQMSRHRHFNAINGLKRYDIALHLDCGYIKSELIDTSSKCVNFTMTCHGKGVPPATTSGSDIAVVQHLCRGEITIK